MSNDKNYNKNLAKWQKLQEIGEAKAKKLGLDTEEKIVENLEIFKTKRVCQYLIKMIK